MAGQPTKFKPEFVELTRKLCVLGATDQQIAEALEVSRAVFRYWKVAHPEFLEALKTGKAEADNRVVESLYQRALGYDAPDGKHIPADVVACIFWLKNRRPDLWRDKHDVDVNHKVTLERLIEQSMGETKPKQIEAKVPHATH